MRLFLSPRILLPLMMFVAVLILGLRLGDLWDEASSGRMFGPVAKAESKSEPAAEAKTDAKPETKAEAASAPVASKPADAPAPAATDDEDKPSHANDAADVSPAEMKVLEQLSTRRAELDKRSHDIDTREAVMKVAEQRVDQKIQEMEKLRQQLQAMVGQVNEQQAAQLDNLVKIYETMKPEDAAHIFDSLDMPTLMSVIQRMKPKSTAPIMAKMTSEKAKEVTVALTKQDQLPAVK